MGQVSIQAAFESPTTLTNATGFLRGYGIETSAQAAMAIVPKQKIAYPQVMFLHFAWSLHVFEVFKLSLLSMSQVAAPLPSYEELALNGPGVEIWDLEHKYIG